jgi:trimethylamine:corrinoid methyltransferase-like protein
LYWAATVITGAAHPKRNTQIGRFDLAYDKEKMTKYWSKQTRLVIVTNLVDSVERNQHLQAKVDELDKQLKINYARYQDLRKHFDNSLKATERLATALAASGVAAGLLADTVKASRV